MVAEPVGETTNFIWDYGMFNLAMVSFNKLLISKKSLSVEFKTVAEPPIVDLLICVCFKGLYLVAFILNYIISPPYDPCTLLSESSSLIEILLVLKINSISEF